MPGDRFKSRSGPVRLARQATGALVAAQVALVWLLPFPVGTDLPGHVALVSVLARYRELGFDEFFEIGWTPTPYMVANGLLLAFARAVDPVTALKGVLTLYFLLLPLAVRYWVRSWPEPDEAKVLFGAALAFSNPYFGGSLNHLWGLLTALVVLGAWVRAYEGPPARRRLILMAGLPALYFCHFTIFALSAGVLFAGSVASRQRRSHLAELAGALLLPALLFAWFAAAADLASGVPRVHAGLYGSYGEALLKRLAFPFGAFHFWGDLLTQAPILLAFLGLLAVGLARGSPPRLLASGLLVPAFLVLALPHTHVLAHPIACRIAHMGLFLLIPALAPLGRATLALLVSGAVAWNAYVGWNLVRTQRAVRDYLAVLERIPPGQPVFPLFESSTKGPESRIFSPFEYLVGYYHAEKGGVSPNLPDRPRSPWATYLFYKDPRYKADSVLLGDFDAARYARLYPYVVYKGNAPAILSLAGSYRETFRAGDVFLLERH